MEALEWSAHMGSGPERRASGNCIGTFVKLTAVSAEIRFTTVGLAEIAGSR